MTEAEARKIFDDALTGEIDPDRIARVQLLREYFCNPDFRTSMADYLASLQEDDAR